MVARLGGDEFAVLCPQLHDDDAAVAIAERVVAALERPFVAEGLEVHIGASVGIATAAPGELDAEQLLDAADRALYQAKADGRGRWHLLSSSPAAEPDAESGPPDPLSARTPGGRRRLRSATIRP